MRFIADRVQLCPRVMTLVALSKQTCMEDAMRYTIPRTAVALALGLSAVGVHAADLRVTVANLEPDAGYLMVALYDTPERFSDREDAVEEIRKPVRGDTLAVTFTGLDPGEYAVAVFQDLDGDGVLDTNMLGMPREPWGFSRDATGRMGPPDFADAAFSVEDETVELPIRLNQP